MRACRTCHAFLYLNDCSNPSPACLSLLPQVTSTQIKESLLLRRFSFAIFLALAGCAEFPQLDAAISEESQNAPYPKLEALAEGPMGPETDVEAETESLLARTIALFTRADWLRNQ